MSISPVENEATGERAPQPAQPFERFFFRSVAAYFKLPVAGDTHLDLVTVLEIQSLDNRCGQTDGKAISPLRYLHRQVS
jgi:hypothetical protein